MNIRKKLILGLAGISLLVGAVVAFAILNNRDIQRDVTDLSSFTVKLNENSTRMSIALMSSQKATQELMAESQHGRLEPDEATEAQAAVAKAELSLAEEIRNFEAAWSAGLSTTERTIAEARERRNVAGVRQDEEELEKLQEINVEFNEYKRNSAQFLALVKTDLTDADEFLVRHTEPHFKTTLLPLVQAHKHLIENELAEETAAIRESVAKANRMLIGSTMVALLFAAFLGFYISRSISKPIRDLQAAATDFGRGNLDSRIAINSSDELGTLAGAFNQMAENLQRTEAERKAIAEIVQSVTTTDNLDALFKLAHHAINKVLPAENCFIALHNATTDLMHYEYWVDKFDPVPSPRPVGKGFSSYMLSTGQPLLLTKEFKSQMYERGEVEKNGADSLSWLGVPLRTGSRTSGVLVVQDYEQEHAYSPRDVEFLASVGDQLGLAIERKQIELELKTNEMQLTEAQHIAKLGSWEWDVQAHKLSWSEELYRIFGLQPKEFEVTYEAFLACVHPDDRDLMESAGEQALHDKMFPNSEYRIVRPDGTIRVLQSNAQVTDDKTGCTIKVVGTALDITERKQVEEKLRQSEGKYRSLLENSPDVTWTTDEKGNTIFISANVESVYGFTSEELLGDDKRSWLERVHPDDLAQVFEGYHSLFAEGKPYDVEFRIQRKDGVWIWLHDRSRMPYEKGGVLYTDGVFSDRSEEHTSELQSP